jgi:aldose 1-epimerase
MDQVLMLTARHYTPDDAQSIPTGEKKAVEGTPMDFRIPKPIGRDIGEDYRCLKLQRGYDHNFEAYAEPCAVLSDPESGRSMAVSTDCPGIQFYSGNFLKSAEHPLKGGYPQNTQAAFCLETQKMPDSINHPNFTDTVLNPGETYTHTTIYSFSVK